MIDRDILGDVGEVVTASRLRSECGMQVVRNIYLPSNNGTTEIDMVGISKFGLFIIENKNYNAKVFGGRSVKYWTVDYMYDKHKLYNPYLQNLLHIRILEECFNINEDIPLYNIVIFSDKSNLEITGLDGTVFRLSDFVTKYNSIRLEGVLDSSTIKDLYGMIGQFSDGSDEMKDIHRLMLEDKDYVSDIEKDY